MKLFLAISTVLLSAALTAARPDVSVGCRDDDGNFVDFIYGYKLPMMKGLNEVDQRGEYESNGLNYLYITPKSTDKWRLSKTYINETDSFVGRTLGGIYSGKFQRTMRDGSGELLVMMYNDEPTMGPVDGTRGHTKGVLIANETNGMWLIHSVPKFPPTLEEGGYDFPKSGMTYGQSFLCISLSGEELGKVGRQLQYNEPHFYFGYVPDYLKSVYPELVEAYAMNPIKKGPFFRTETITSRDGVEFTSFAKTRKFEKELYADLVVPFFGGGDYYAETWRHGGGNLPSNCSRTSKIFNVKSISIRNKGIGFETMKDHSKWLVGRNRDVVCVGDINRQEHQMMRGGGTMCSGGSSAIAGLYRGIVGDVEGCSRRMIDNHHHKSLDSESSSEEFM